MKSQKTKYNPDNLRKKLKSFKEQGIDVYFDVYFINGKKKEIAITRQPLSNFKMIGQLIKVDSPEIIRVEVYNGVNASVMHWIDDYQIDDNEVDEIQNVNPFHVNQFQGFGEAEINNLVDQRLQEQKRIEDHQNLKVKVKELSAELDVQYDLVEKLETKNTELLRQLESKKTIRYYAGMLGDVLESIGIPKSKIKPQVASLFGISDEDTSNEDNQNSKIDNSGVVDDELSEEEQKREEIISLMTDYLRTRDNQTLLNLFNIFSEVEKDPKIAFEIISFIESKNK